MNDPRSVAVFCGAAFGTAPAYRRAAAAFGTGLAQAGMRLIYGGGRIGLMGTVADAALAAGGAVLGVIPDFLQRREVSHDGVVDLIVTDSMHTRKRHMFDAADAFAILPGGLGTMDEAMEIITWRQLGLHDKPILFCNIEGSAMPLVGAIEAAIAAGFARPEVRTIYEVHDSVDACLARLQSLPLAAHGASALL
jgi:uncharacterized protein (TIGR00730 family)